MEEKLSSVRKFSIYSIVLVILLHISGCSTQKNTGTTRFFHNLTSRYNVLFNATEAYKAGLLKLQSDYRDDYTELLPVFYYYDATQLGGISGEMDRTIEKATKLITMHSITAKPELEPGKEMTAKEREFYNQSEFNHYVDDAYLLIGKANLYKNDISKAEETFSFIISNFENTPVIWESRLWQARIALTKGRLKEADQILKELQESPNLNKKQKEILYPTLVDYQLRDEKFPEALSTLEKAIEFAGNKTLKTRYYFLAAQISQDLNQFNKAIDYYDQVIKLNPPYQMTFNAKINLANSYEAGKSDRADIERKLRKMLKDDKNNDFQDQIYYALANIAMQEGETEHAIELYKESLVHKGQNLKQQTIAYLTLADIYYDRQQYIEAQAYYDSTVKMIDSGFPDYSTLVNKSSSLTNLVGYLQTVEIEDSVQILARMPQPELYAYVDRLIAQNIKEEQRKREAEQARFESENNVFDNPIPATAEGGWYFYNPTTLNLGRQEFKRIWGNRPLEDNWRRKNKTSGIESPVVNPENENLAVAGTTTTPQGKSPTTSNDIRSREYYLQNIPFTDSMMTASHERIKKALFNIGEIYGFELKDYDQSIEAFNELLKRYPEYDNRLMVYYRMYILGQETGNTSLKNQYKAKIISEYPNSTYAKIMANPDYFKEVEAAENKIYTFYDETYRYFTEGNIGKTISRSRDAMQQYPEHELYPKFDYLNTVASGKSKDTLSFLADLEAYANRYPASDLAQTAQSLIKYLTSKEEKILIRHQTQSARNIFDTVTDGVQYVAFTLPVGKNTNQMVFNIITFNVEYYAQIELDVKKEPLNNSFTICVVRKFDNAKDAITYKKRLMGYADLWRDVDREGIAGFVISPDNLSKLKETGEVNKYIAFERDNY